MYNKGMLEDILNNQISLYEKETSSEKKGEIVKETIEKIETSILGFYGQRGHISPKQSKNISSCTLESAVFFKKHIEINDAYTDFVTNILSHLLNINKAENVRIFSKHRKDGERKLSTQTIDEIIETLSLSNINENTTGNPKETNRKEINKTDLLKKEKNNFIGLLQDLEKNGFIQKSQRIEIQKIVEENGGIAYAKDLLQRELHDKEIKEKYYKKGCKKKRIDKEKVEPIRPKIIIQEKVEPIKPKTIVQEKTEPEEQKIIVQEKVKPEEQKTIVQEKVKPEEQKTIVQEKVKPEEQKTIVQEKVKPEEQKTIVQEEKTHKTIEGYDGLLPMFQGIIMNGGMFYKGFFDEVSDAALDTIQREHLETIKEELTRFCKNRYVFYKDRKGAERFFLKTNKALIKRGEMDKKILSLKEKNTKEIPIILDGIIEMVEGSKEEIKKIIKSNKNRQKKFTEITQRLESLKANITETRKVFDSLGISGFVSDIYNDTKTTLDRYKGMDEKRKEICIKNNFFMGDIAEMIKTLEEGKKEERMKKIKLYLERGEINNIIDNE